jgi:uncharacterized protein YdhG (YjbR/CyaY superfamily)
VYDFARSIEDGATVPLYYENRIPEVQLTNQELNRDLEALLQSIRAAARAAAPQAQERLSYRMPSLFQYGVLLHYAAFKQHIGLFPPVTEPVLREKAARYAGPKGNLQLTTRARCSATTSASMTSRARSRTAPRCRCTTRWSASSSWL